MIESERPSKTKIKQQMIELQELGEKLVSLKGEQLDAMSLPDELRLALEEVRRVSAREARRRQLQYIGRLMRAVDPEPIRRELASLDGRSREDAIRQRGIERWRDRLLEDDGAIEELLRERPDADARRLRALIRDARAERGASRPPRAYRELFRLLRDLLRGSQP